jgi:hypothetical protein
MIRCYGPKYPMGGPLLSSAYEFFMSIGHRQSERLNEIRPRKYPLSQRSFFVPSQHRQSPTIFSTFLLQSIFSIIFYYIIIPKILPT